ncbi:unnamed protein product [Lymnaea stagnalis]|uniref:Uncharacterized protein n=1 Tax=Lymnaea stagnalis TaxID=6523 RepID=A0AAV2HBD6_LYMST
MGGINSHGKDSKGDNLDTPKHEFKKDLSDVVYFLVQHESFNPPNNFTKWTPMMHAIWEGRHDIMECLLEFEPIAVNSSCPKGLTPLMIASIKGDVKALDFLIARGSVVDRRDTYKWTALMHGAHAGNLGSVEKLCKHGADVNTSDRNGCTVLMIASIQGHLNVLSFIAEKVFCVDSVDSDGMTAFLHAAKAGHLLVMKLLDQKLSVNKSLSDRNGFTALIWASKEGHISIVKFLIEMGCDVDAVDHEGWSALMHGVMETQVEVVTLLTPRANINVRSTMGYTALMLASIRDNITSVDKLLDMDTCDVDVVDHMGWTPLMHAVVERKYDSVKRLCCRNADATISCPAGMTAMKLSRARNDKVFIDLLVQYGGCSRESREGGMEGNPRLDGEKRIDLVDEADLDFPVLRKKKQIQYVRETIISRTSVSNNTDIDRCSRFEQDENNTEYKSFLSQLNLSAQDMRILSRNEDTFQNRWKTKILDSMSRYSETESSESNSGQRKSSLSSLWVNVSFSSITESNVCLEDLLDSDSLRSSRAEVVSACSGPDCSREKRKERSSHLVETILRELPKLKNSHITINISDRSRHIVTFVTECENLSTGEYGKIKCNKTKTL